MPTDENQNVGTSANSNGGINPDAVNNANVEPIINDKKLDIDLNLDGIDTPEVSSTEELVVKKIVEKTVEPVEESVVQEHKKDVASIVEIQEELEPPLEELKDLPILEAEKIEESDSDRLLEEDKKVEELQETKLAEEVKQTDISDLGNLDIPFVETKVEELHTENLGEAVVENKDGDIVSDTGEMDGDKGGYIPNEHDFNQVTDVLNGTEQGPVDLGTLEKKGNISNDLKEGVDFKKEESVVGGMDLDSMIANMGAETNSLLETADASKNIDLGSSETVVNDNIEQVNTAVENTDNVVTNVVNDTVNTSVVNENMVAPGTVILTEDPTKKNKHTGLKIFVLIIVLIVLGVFMLSKMYPEEFGDVMSAIQGEDTTVIEYSDNADSGVVLDETQNVDVELTGDIEEVEELDPNSLAGQLENNNESGNVIEYSTDTGAVSEASGHNADVTEEGFNAFEGLEEVMDPVNSANADLLVKLRKYQTKGIEYDIWGRAIGNTTAMKYGLYISEKAESVINDIETNVKIDNTKVENYFAQFDIYIAKLDKLRVSIDGEVQDDALVSTGTDEQSTDSTASTGTVQ